MVAQAAGEAERGATWTAAGAAGDAGDREAEDALTMATDDRGDSHVTEARTPEADNRTARAIALMDAGYTQAAAARAVGISEQSVRAGRRARGMGPIENPPRVPRGPALRPRQPGDKTNRRVFADRPVEIGDEDVCTDDRCITVELHRAGDGCDYRGTARPGNGRRSA